MEHIFRIVDFNVYNGKDSSHESSDDEQNVYKDSNSFVIQIFGVDENGKTYSYEGCGEQAMKKNEINGNFIVIIEIIDDEFFKIGSNFDLIFDHQISLKESIIGKNLIIPHMEEPFVVDTKQFCIINPNKSYIIPKKGLQDELGNKGNLVLKFKINYPDRFLNNTEIKLLEDVFKNIEI